jgi:hypothetical protein
MELKLTDEYYEMCATWQGDVAEILRDVLLKKGISQDDAKDITGDFMFNLSMLHDQGEIKFGRSQFNPRLCFHDFGSTLLSIDEDTYLHESAYGVVASVYED